MADTAYTTGSNLSGAEEAGIELIGPTAEVETENNPAIRADLTLPGSCREHWSVADQSSNEAVR
ncbi:MAG: hypothetical protein U0892_23590 [Pirellulales bacterium]